MAEIIDKNTFFEEQNLSSIFAMLQNDYCTKFNTNPQDIRNGTFLYYDLLILAYCIMFCLDYAKYVLSQLSPSQADDYGIYNIWCENYNINPNPGTKTLISTTCIFSKNVKLWKTLPDDNVNNYLGQVMDDDGNIYTIATNSEYVAGTYQNVIFECNNYGRIIPQESGQLSIVNLLDGWGVNGGSVGDIHIISIGSEPDTLDDIRETIDKTSNIHNPKNLYQGLIKDLVNAGCKSAKWYKSTNDNNLQEKGLVNGQTLIVVQTGDQDKIFDILEQYLLGVNLAGSVIKSLIYYNTQYVLRFSYASQVPFYIKLVINKMGIVITNPDVFKMNMKNYILEQLQNYSTIETTFLNTGIIFTLAQKFLDSQGLSVMLISDCQLSTDNQEWSQVITTEDLITYFYITDTTYIDIVFSDEL